MTIRSLWPYLVAAGLLLVLGLAFAFVTGRQEIVLYAILGVVMCVFLGRAAAGHPRYRIMRDDGKERKP